MCLKGAVRLSLLLLRREIMLFFRRFGDMLLLTCLPRWLDPDDLPRGSKGSSVCSERDNLCQTFFLRRRQQKKYKILLSMSYLFSSLSESLPPNEVIKVIFSVEGDRDESDPEFPEEEFSLSSNSLFRAA